MATDLVALQLQKVARPRVNHELQHLCWVADLAVLLGFAVESSATVTREVRFH